jgi:hypothetical protein
MIPLSLPVPDKPEPIGLSTQIKSRIVPREMDGLWFRTKYRSRGKKPGPRSCGEPGAAPVWQDNFRMDVLSCLYPGQVFGNE